MLLVVRREGNRLPRYVHLGTGNYHPKTARLYTDYGLLTCDFEIGRDVHDIFMQITSPGHVPGLKHHGHGAPSLTPAMVFTRIETSSPIRPSSISSLALTYTG